MYNVFYCPKCGNEQQISISIGEECSIQTCIKCGTSLILKCCGECDICKKDNCSREMVIEFGTNFRQENLDNVSYLH